MFDCVKAGAFGKHPAGKNALLLTVQKHLVDFDEARCFGLFGRRPGIARARDQLQRSERDRVAEVALQARDACRDLIEGCKNRGFVFDPLRMGAADAARHKCGSS